MFKRYLYSLLSVVMLTASVVAWSPTESHALNLSIDELAAPEDPVDPDPPAPEPEFEILGEVPPTCPELTWVLNPSQIRFYKSFRDQDKPGCQYTQCVPFDYDLSNENEDFDESNIFEIQEQFRPKPHVCWDELDFDLSEAPPLEDPLLWSGASGGIDWFVSKGWLIANNEFIPCLESDADDEGDICYVPEPEPKGPGDEVAPEPTEPEPCVGPQCDAPGDLVAPDPDCFDINGDPAICTPLTIDFPEDGDTLNKEDLFDVGGTCHPGAWVFASLNTKKNEGFSFCSNEGTWAMNDMVWLDSVQKGSTQTIEAFQVFPVTEDVSDSVSIDVLIAEDDLPLAACSDGDDNDLDGKTDIDDPGCHTDGDPGNEGSYDPEDDDEQDEGCFDDAGAPIDCPECSDGENNDDNDNLPDIKDPECHIDGDPNDDDDSYDPEDDEEDPECSDGKNNDKEEDELIDEDDPGCWTIPGDKDSYDPEDDDEEDEPGDDEDKPECSDDEDNDNDGFNNEEDPGCHTDGDPGNEDSYDPDDDNEDDEPEDEDKPECSDDEDNDNDGFNNEEDPGCHTDGDPGNEDSYDPDDDNEDDEPEDEDKPECSDDEDNDNDGFNNEEDPGCHTDGDPGNEDSYDPDDDNEDDPGDAPEQNDEGAIIFDGDVDPDRTCLEYDPVRRLVFSDLDLSDYGAKHALVLKNTSLSLGQGDDSVNQFILSGQNSNAITTGESLVTLEKEMTRLAWVKLLMLSHCMAIYDDLSLPEVRYDGSPMPNFFDFPDTRHDWVADIVWSGVYYGIWDGTVAGNIEWERPMRLGELVKTLVRVEEFRRGSEFPEDNNAIPAGDVNPGDWYYPFYAKADNLEGLISPYVRARENAVRNESVIFLLENMLDRDLYSSDDEGTIEDILSNN